MARLGQKKNRAERQRKPQPQKAHTNKDQLA
jgi:hypothetical protein